MKNTIVCSLASVTAAVLLAASLARGADRGQVLGTREQANSEAAKSQQRVDSLSDQADDLATEYRSVIDQIDALRIYNGQLDKLIADQTAEMESLQLQIDQVQLVGRELTPLMLEMIDTLEAFVRLDIPFLPEERQRRLSGLHELMERADVSDSERYRRILEAYQIENEYGRTIEAYRGAMPFGGEERTVDFLRVGRICLVYQTLDGERSGVWDQAGRQWIDLPSGYRVAIRQGLRIARKQAAPDLIQLPIPAAAEATP